MRKRPFVLAVVPVSLAGASGDSVNERQLLEALSKQVERIIIFSIVPFPKLRRFSEPEIYNGTIVELPYIRFLSMFFTIWYSFIIMFVACLLDAVHKINFIYVRGSFSAFGLMFNRKLAKKTLVKHPSFIEDELKIQGTILSLIKKCSLVIDKIVLSKCNKIGIPSRLYIRYLAKRRLVVRPISDYIVVPPGVNLSKIFQMVNFHSLGNSDDKIKIGFIGTITWWQGIDILVKACSIVKNKFPNIKLVLIGGGNQRELDLVEGICKKENLDYEITGYMPHEDALKRLRELDVMVLPRRRISATESNIPLKVIEAWALGIPVIATRHKVFLENGIRDYEDVIFCEPQPLSVANAILMLLNEPALREKLRINGFRLAFRFDYNRIAQNLLKVFEENV
ncbi:MAG: glycosyltransferase family 4 protein [Thermofilaceae archaeon]